MAVKKLIGTIEYKDNLAGNVWLVRIKFDEDLYFSAGQYVSVKVSEEGERRSYSIASLPSVVNGDKRDYIDIVVDITPMGVGSKFFLNTKVNEKVEVMGFLGKFTVDEISLEETDTLLFVANGTGIVPLKPMIENLLEVKSFKGKVILVWGMRKEEDLYWTEEIERLTRDFDNFSFEMVLSIPDDDWPGNRGHVGDVIKDLNIKWQKVRAYLCGAPEMVEEMEGLLVAKGVDNNNIVHEKFG